MKRLIVTLLVLSMLIFAVACGNNEPAQTPPAQEPAETTEPAETAETTEPAEGTEEPAGEYKAEEPVLLTSVGQSADVEMVKSMLERVGIDYTPNNLATSADIGDAKTLVLAIGGSSKGLGAAGIDADAELVRVKELIDAADEAGLSIIAVHIGGEARRGELSDRFIAPSFEKADYSIVVKAGDSDGMMEGLAKDKGIGINLIDSITDTTGALEGIFK